MAAYLGTISEFSSTQESWTAYVEHLVKYMAANKIQEPDQQRAVLLSVCGSATYRLIHNLGGMFQGQELATSSKSKNCQIWTFGLKKHSIFGNFKVLPLLANSITRYLMNAQYSISDSLLLCCQNWLHLSFIPSISRYGKTCAVFL